MLKGQCHNIFSPNFLSLNYTEPMIDMLQHFHIWLRIRGEIHIERADFLFP